MRWDSNPHSLALKAGGRPLADSPLHFAPDESQTRKKLPVLNWDEWALSPWSQEQTFFNSAKNSSSVRKFFTAGASIKGFMLIPMEATAFPLPRA